MACIALLSLYFSVFSKIGFLCVALTTLELALYIDQFGFKLTEICLPLPPECWDQRCPCISGVLNFILLLGEVDYVCVYVTCSALCAMVQFTLWARGWRLTLTQTETQVILEFPKNAPLN